MEKKKGNGLSDAFQLHTTHLSNLTQYCCMTCPVVIRTYYLLD